MGKKEYLKMGYLSRRNRLFAMILALLMFLALPAISGLAEAEVILDAWGEYDNLPADEVWITIGSDGIETQEPPDIGGPVVLEPEHVDRDEAVSDADTGTSDNSSGFTITDGVLVKYVGYGGKVVIPNGVSVIGEWAFSYCSTMTALDIPSSVVSIEKNAFHWCTGLTSLTIPGSVRTIGEGAFWDCNNMADIFISQGVAQIGTDAFKFCDSLTSVVIPASVTSIGSGAFDSCGRLSSVTIYAKDISFGEGAFDAGVAVYAYPGSSAYQWAQTHGYSVRPITETEALSATSLALNVGETQALEVSGLAGRTVAWSSSDSSIASVANGVVTAKKPGKCSVYAAVNGGKTLECKVTVADTARLSSTSVKLKLGKTHTLKISGLAGRPVTWSSSNNKVATVKKGKIAAKKAGQCVISAKIKGGKTLKCKVSVTDPAALSRSSVALSSVDSATIKLSGLMGRSVKWSTSKKAVAKITDSGSGYVTIKGIRPGAATIKAAIQDGKTLKCKVKVVDPLAITMEELSQESGNNLLFVKFTNQSDKNITYIRFDVLQYNSRGAGLASPYTYYEHNKAVKAHNNGTARVWVNGSTEKVKFKILEVRFSDTTTWKP